MTTKPTGHDMSKDDVETKDRIIDLSKKNSEDGWSYAAQRFFERLTALWFKWLGWIFATGGVAFLAKKTGSVPLFIIETISYFLLTWYFLYFFASIRVEPYNSWARGRSSKGKRTLALLPAFSAAITLTLGARLLIGHVITQIQLGQ